jgi:hypothetical protein
MTEQESREFDIYFRDLVQESTCKTCVTHGDTDGVLELKKPFPIKNISKDVLQFISGIDCETGILICNTKFVRYTDLSLYDIRSLHHYVVINQQYTFKSDH